MPQPRKKIGPKKKSGTATNKKKISIHRGDAAKNVGPVWGVPPTWVQHPKPLSPEVVSAYRLTMPCPKLNVQHHPAADCAGCPTCVGCVLPATHVPGPNATKKDMEAFTRRVLLPYEARKTATTTNNNNNNNKSKNKSETMCCAATILKTSPCYVTSCAAPDGTTTSSWTKLIDLTLFSTNRRPPRCLCRRRHRCRRFRCDRSRQHQGRHQKGSAQFMGQQGHEQRQ
eukprot:PhM_4_TR9751/c2_g1_i1/m.80838